ncbi:MAG: hypothetical protein EP329_23330 [Deltaproteobacteria bacterium]|nr:MAG: hypothetical protein EP329_23330 [Deltaproteobacteria bacterium]
MKRLLLSALFAATAALGACPDKQIMPLIGEGPEVYKLLEADAPDDPASSPLAAARRLHQSLMQDDAEMVWTLLAAPTRRALDERAATISASGRELIDASTLPGPGGTVRKVRYESIFFGPHVIDLRDGKKTSQTPFGEGRVVLATSQDKTETELVFVREEDGWKLLKTGF